MPKMNCDWDINCPYWNPLNEECTKDTCDKKKGVKWQSLMLEDTEVLRYTRGEGIVVGKPELLPFGLRGGQVDYDRFSDWLRDRADHLRRTYMNQVYIVRKIGRDFNKIIRDSCAISITDRYWILRDDRMTTWEGLQKLRDSNTMLAKMALSGKLPAEEWEEAARGFTSIYTITGAFPKALVGDEIWKRGFNAEYEVVASKVGKYCGIDVQDASIDDSGLVRLKIFTNGLSLVHAGELLSSLGEQVCDNGHEQLYTHFKAIGRDDIVKQMELQFLLIYLCCNTDYHEENYAFLYEPRTFEIKKLAPAYDFNNAFSEGHPAGSYFYKTILRLLPSIAKANPEVIERLKTIQADSEILTGLNEVQVKELLERRDHLLQMI